MKIDPLFKKTFDGSDLAIYGECIESALEFYAGDNGDNDVQSFIEWFTETYIHHAQVIYYHTAMEYLMEHDPSLRESMDLANDMGANTNDINSEYLASILLQQNLSSELYDFEDELEQYFSDKEESEAA
jgi:hypothetical protein